MYGAEIFEKWELLLPEKSEGGYLVFELYSRIQAKELSPEFATEDMRLLLEEIKAKHRMPNAPYSERVIKGLLHFFIRAVPGRHGRYELTDYAVRLMELVLHKLHNPYKNYPLKQSFEKYFVLRAGELKSINELETKFGRGFTASQKQIITDHLEALQDELTEAYTQLNAILFAENEDATTMVRRFTEVFKKFSERAEDISYAVSSKDDFLKRLRWRVDEYYDQTQGYKSPQSDEEKLALATFQDAWQRSVAIATDLEAFFSTVDGKIANIRRQVLNASGKLAELQENFSSRSQFRLLVKKLYQVCLESASNRRGTVVFSQPFPLKYLVCEKTQLFYPEYIPFQRTLANRITLVTTNKAYEEEQRATIEAENKRQALIQHWVSTGKQRLAERQTLNLTELMAEIIKTTGDLYVAQSVTIELSQFSAENLGFGLEIEKRLQTLTNQNMHTWKMIITPQATTVS